MVALHHTGWTWAPYVQELSGGPLWGSPSQLSSGTAQRESPVRGRRSVSQSPVSQLVPPLDFQQVESFT